MVCAPSSCHHDDLQHQPPCLKLPKPHLHAHRCRTRTSMPLERIKSGRKDRIKSKYQGSKPKAGHVEAVHPRSTATMEVEDGLPAPPPPSSSSKPPSPRATTPPPKAQAVAGPLGRKGPRVSQCHCWGGRDQGRAAPMSRPPLGRKGPRAHRRRIMATARESRTEGAPSS
jgi:hypothetical protein